MSKEKTIKLNEKQVKIVKDALVREKAVNEDLIKKNKQYPTREQHISEVYEIEKIEKQLD